MVTSLGPHARILIKSNDFSPTQLVSGCDLNPVAMGTLATPTARMRIKVLVAKTVFVISAEALEFSPKAQVLIVLLCVALVFWFNLRAVRPGHGLGSGVWSGFRALIIVLCVALVFCFEL